jgi:presenilin-like A22 family membrane protease
MKHNVKITLILITMFLVTQFLGLYVISFYGQGYKIPYGMQPPQEKPTETSLLATILTSFVLAIVLFFVLTKIKAEKFLRFWFFAVSILAMGLTINVFLLKLNIFYSLLGLLIALPLAYFKIYKRNFWVHNISELLIYPGISVVFVPLLGVTSIIILLLIISLYDIWAVWHTGFMQKMAKYQMNTLQIFAGFFLPYAGKKEKMKIKLIKEKYKNKSEKEIEKQLTKAKVKINLAILGGGDVVFPIITAGVFYNLAGLIPALIITLSSTISLAVLFILARKGKFYPAMPFLSIGMYIGMMINWCLA